MPFGNRRFTGRTALGAAEFYAIDSPSQFWTGLQDLHDLQVESKANYAPKELKRTDTRRR